MEINKIIVDVLKTNQSDSFEKIAEDIIKALSSDFKSSATIMIKHLCDNHHPHHSVIITHTGAELLEGKQTTGEVFDYLLD